MKINNRIAHFAARWGPPTAAALRQAVDHLAAKRKDGPRWSSCRFEPPSGSDEALDISIGFRLLHLCSLRHFRVCHKNEGIWQVLASSRGPFSSDILQSTMDRFRRLDLKASKSADVTYLVKCTDNSASDTLGRFVIEFGWRTQSGPPGYFIRASSLDGRTQSAFRYVFVNSAIEHLGLKDIVRVVGDDRDFVLRAVDGWSLYELETDWPPHDHNPSFFRIGPFASFDDVWQRAERFLASPLGKQIDRLAVSFFLAPDIYETMYEQLNALANGWRVDFFGSYGEGIDPYTADASQSPDGRFPVFVWSPARDAGDLFYQADVPTAEGRLLEIHSNCGDMKKLLKEAEAATGLKFTPVGESLRS